MIEILVIRDPDMADEVTVWVDGVERTADVIEIHVDAGAGYDFEDWRANADAWDRDPRLSDAARQAAAEAFVDPPGWTYIDGFKELGNPPMHCPKCGRYGNEEDLCVVGEECPADDCDGTVEYNWEER